MEVLPYDSVKAVELSWNLGMGTNRHIDSFTHLYIDMYITQFIGHEDYIHVFKNTHSGFQSIHVPQGNTSNASRASCSLMDGHLAGCDDAICACNPGPS